MLRLLTCSLIILIMGATLSGVSAAPADAPLAQGSPTVTPTPTATLVPSATSVNSSTPTVTGTPSVTATRTTTATATATNLPGPDLAITLSGALSVLGTGQQAIVYTLLVTNNGTTVTS